MRKRIHHAERPLRKKARSTSNSLFRNTLRVSYLYPILCGGLAGSDFPKCFRSNTLGAMLQKKIWRAQVRERQQLLVPQYFTCKFLAINTLRMIRQEIVQQVLLIEYFSMDVSKKIPPQPTADGFPRAEACSCFHPRAQSQRSHP